jgi:hypothetical protein
MALRPPPVLEMKDMVAGLTILVGNRSIVNKSSESPGSKANMPLVSATQTKKIDASICRTDLGKDPKELIPFKDESFMDF